MTVLKMFSNTFFFYVHDVKVMAEEIGFPIRKLQKIIRFALVMGQTKTGKLLLTKLKTNTMSSYSDTTSCNSSPERCECLVSIPVIRWKDMTVAVKKKALPPFVSVNALLFSMQYGHASFAFMLQQE
jgi:hypothetical protein